MYVQNMIHCTVFIKTIQQLMYNNNNKLNLFAHPNNKLRLCTAAYFQTHLYCFHISTEQF